VDLASRPGDGSRGDAAHRNQHGCSGRGHEDVTVHVSLLFHSWIQRPPRAIDASE
jgi:hypothetical protein